MEHTMDWYKFFVQGRILENWSQNRDTKKLYLNLSNSAILRCLLGSDPPLQNCITKCHFLPSWCHPKCIPRSPKTVLHIWHAPKEPYKIPPASLIEVYSSRICCHYLSLNLELSSQTHIARISFLILLELKCHSSINIWVVTFSLQLLQNIWITYNSH